MKESLYNNIIKQLSQYTERDDELQCLSRDFPNVDFGQLECIYKQDMQRKVKEHHKYYFQKRVLNKMYTNYLTRKENGEPPGILLRIAKQNKYSPALLSKHLLEHYLRNVKKMENDERYDEEVLGTTPIPLTPPRTSPTTEVCSNVISVENTQISVPFQPQSEAHFSTPSQKNSTRDSSNDSASGYAYHNASQECKKSLQKPNNKFNGLSNSNSINLEPKSSDTKKFEKSKLNKLYRDTSLIPDKNLSLEIHLCISQDQLYGPYADSIKHTIGHEHEVLLYRKLDELDISYKNENDLRLLGYDKTPDVLLDIPIGVNNRVVNWIESKGSFGDRENHSSYLEKQYWSYWNRFGPGLVIYWFGYIEELDTEREKGIMLAEKFPSSVVFLDPTSDKLEDRDATSL